MKSLNVLPLILFFFPLMVCAEGVYKWRDDDGAMHYSSEPPVGGVIAERVLIVPPPRSATAQGSTRQSQYRTHKANKAADDLARKTDARIQNRKDLHAQLKQAKKKLKKTQQALADGQAPLPGERLGRAGGGTRLGPAYQKRIHQLEKNIEGAELNIKKIKRSLRGLSR